MKRTIATVNEMPLQLVDLESTDVCLNKHVEKLSHELFRLRRELYRSQINVNISAATTMMVMAFLKLAGKDEMSRDEIVTSCLDTASKHDTNAYRLNNLIKKCEDEIAFYEKFITSTLVQRAETIALVKKLGRIPTAADG